MTVPRRLENPPREVPHSQNKPNVRKEVIQDNEGFWWKLTATASVAAAPSDRRRVSRQVNVELAASVYSVVRCPVGEVDELKSVLAEHTVISSMDEYLISDAMSHPEKVISIVLGTWKHKSIALDENQGFLTVMLVDSAFRAATRQLGDLRQIGIEGRIVGSLSEADAAVKAVNHG